MRFSRRARHLPTGSRPRPIPLMVAAGAVALTAACTGGGGSRTGAEDTAAAPTTTPTSAGSQDDPGSGTDGTDGAGGEDAADGRTDTDGTDATGGEDTADAGTDADGTDGEDTADEAPAAAADVALFPGVGEFGIAFDVLNIQLHEQFDLARIDVTGTGVKLPDGGGPGAFVIDAYPDGTIGGRVTDTGEVAAVATVSDTDAAAGRSAVLTLMAITLDDDDATIDAVYRALADVADLGPGTARYVTNQGRGVLFEQVEIGGLPHLSVVVSAETDQATAAGAAADLRAAMDERFAR